MFEPVGLRAVAISAVPPVHVGPGCLRRDLPSRSGVRTWAVEMEPGAVWPRIDEHDGLGEDVFVLSGEVIEGERRFGPGSYLHFEPDSRHRPRTETGVVLVGFNLIA